MIDLDKETVVGELADTPGVHGIAIVPELGKGFTSNGSDSSVTVFDLKTLKATGKIKASGVPDAILYDPASKRVVTFNHGTNDGTVDRPGHGEGGRHDRLRGRARGGRRRREGAHLRQHPQLERDRRVRRPHAEDPQPMAARPGQRPNGLAIDAKNRRLFSGCNGNSKMVVMDADKGTVLATVDIGRGSDGCGFDPARGLAYSANGGDGTVTVIGEPEPGKFKVVATIPTQATARTMTLDPKTHRLYLSAATPAARAAADGASRRPRAAAGAMSRVHS